jgi:hypothetical protein
MITFPDGTRSGVVGLNEVMEYLYLEGKPATDAVAIEMMEALESRNYFPSSERHIYKALLLSEYRHFLESKLK